MTKADLVKAMDRAISEMSSRYGVHFMIGFRNALIDKATQGLDDNGTIDVQEAHDRMAVALSDAKQAYNLSLPAEEMSSIINLGLGSVTTLNISGAETVSMDIAADVTPPDTADALPDSGPSTVEPPPTDETTV